MIFGREPWTDHLEYLVRKLSEALTQVKDEQSYIVVRERVHRNTAESTNGRVKWWSMFQLAVVIGEGVFQVWWLKRFFEVCFFNWVVTEDGRSRLRHGANSVMVRRSSVWSDLDLWLPWIEISSDVGRMWWIWTCWGSQCNSPGNLSRFHAMVSCDHP
jgi:hypothetical protein